MRPTDIFIRRPVLAVVVNLMILIAGLQAIRSVSVRQYPKIESATITVKTVYVGADSNLVRGFITAPLERAIAAADGIDYIESQSSSGYRPSTCACELNFPRPSRSSDISARVNQVRADLPPEAEIPTHQHRAFRRAIRGDVPDVRLRYPREQPGHRLPDSRGPATSDRDRRCAARRYPRWTHVRTAGVAEARSDGRTRREPRPGARSARRQQLSCGGRSVEGKPDSDRPDRDAPT